MESRGATEYCRKQTVGGRAGEKGEAMEGAYLQKARVEEQGNARVKNARVV